MIDRETVDRIYAAANIVDIIGDYVTLKRKGVNYQACCPFHNEKTPSFTVYPETKKPRRSSSRPRKGFINASAAARAAMP